MFLNNTIRPKRIHLYSLMYIYYTFVVYLFLAYNNGLLGYIAVPLYVISYAVNTALILISFIINKLTPNLVILNILSSLWIIWGLYSEIYSNGLNKKTMIPLIILAIISTTLRNIRD